MSGLEFTGSRNAPSAGSSGSGVILPWATGTAYKAGQPVTNGGKTWLAVDDHTAGATFSGDSAHWTVLPVASTGLTPTGVKTANYTAVPGDLVLVDTTSGPVTVTLPAAAAGAAPIGVKMVTLGGSNAVTIAAAGSDVFNKAGGATSLSLTLLNQGVVLTPAAGLWVVQADDLPLSALARLRTVTSVAYAATVTPAIPAGGGDAVLNIGALTGNITIANPAGTPVDGQTIRLRLAQDATGGRTISWGAGYAFSTDVPSSLVPLTATTTFEILLSYHAATSVWRCLSILRGF